MSDSLLAGPVTVVTQTRVREGMTEQFASWQSKISAAIAGFPGFTGQSVLPPNPPLQVDWVILQRFASAEAGSAWRPLRGADAALARSSADAGGTG